MDNEITAQELIEEIVNTFSDYDNENKYIGILNFMTLLIRAAKLLDEQDKELTMLYSQYMESR